MMQEPGQFTAKPRSVEAMQWDGTPAGAHRILAWVYSCGGVGSVSGTSPLLSVRNSGDGYEDVEVFLGSWVVLGGRIFEVLDDDTFCGQFQPAPRVVAAVRDSLGSRDDWRG